jgi:NitT/TauT family transport system substrate-binding protein
MTLPSSQRFFLTFLLLSLWITVSACQAVTSAPALTPLALQFNRVHGAQMAGGFYAADQNGYYAEEGLEVTFVEGGLQVDETAALLDGSAQFGLVPGDALLLERAAGKPVRAVATILRREPFVFFSLAESGITRPEDFVGKKVLVTATTRPRLHAILGRVGVSPDQITEVTTGDFTGLYSGAIDVAGGSMVNTVLQAQQDGHAVNIINLDNYGIHFYSDTLFASDEFIAANSDLVTRFLRASLEGWRYAVENPEAIGPMVLEYSPNADVAFETEKMVATLPYVNTGEDFVGWMKPEIWEGMVNTLRDEGILTTPLETTDIYTMEFIQQIYEGS